MSHFDPWLGDSSFTSRKQVSVGKCPILIHGLGIQVSHHKNKYLLEMKTYIPYFFGWCDCQPLGHLPSPESFIAMAVVIPGHCTFRLWPVLSTAKSAVRLREFTRRGKRGTWGTGLEIGYPNNCHRQHQLDVFVGRSNCFVQWTCWMTCSPCWRATSLWGVPGILSG